MSEPYDLLINSVLAIRSDNELTESFRRILGLASMTQQVRVAALLAEVEKRGAPDEVKQFVRLLGNDKLAELVFTQIKAD
jgi:hypothetical protein